ncbi:ribonuclease H-like domain-containing protein [Tanacetum coccineum]
MAELQLRVCGALDGAVNISGPIGELDGTPTLPDVSEKDSIRHIWQGRYDILGWIPWSARYAEGIHRIGNWSNAFSCEVLVRIRRISFVGYGVLIGSTTAFNSGAAQQTTPGPTGLIPTGHATLLPCKHLLSGLYMTQIPVHGIWTQDFMTRRVLLRCDSTGDLYPVMAHSPISHVFLVSQHTWHQRLGHPGSDVLRRLVSNNVISCNNEKPPVLCHACQLGKHVWLPFVSSTTIVTSCFDIIHSDVWTSPIPRKLVISLDDVEEMYSPQFSESYRKEQSPVEEVE